MCTNTVDHQIPKDFGMCRRHRNIAIGMMLRTCATMIEFIRFCMKERFLQDGDTSQVAWSKVQWYGSIVH